MKQLLLFVCLSAALVGCGRSGVRRTDSPAPQTPPASAAFRPAAAPDSLDSADRRRWLAAHWWDTVDCTDSLFFARIDSAALLDAFVRYAAACLDPLDPAPVAALMEKASASRSSLLFFAWMADRVFYDPNSPLRSDELYIPVLEALVRSPWLDRWEKIAPQHDLRMAMQNRPGHKANDIRYTLASGRTSNLYSLQADFVLVFINNPGCPLCKELREAIVASPMLSEMIERGELIVLAIYPDEDLGEWHTYRDRIPPTWINGYDKGTCIREQETYDLKAIPALYLLDGQKRVLLKDEIDVGRVEWMIDRAR